MWLDDEISIWWCLGDTWRCTPSEAMGIWLVILFYTTFFVVTVVHIVIQDQNGTAGRNEEAPRRISAGDQADDWVIVCFLLVYFFFLGSRQLSVGSAWQQVGTPTPDLADPARWFGDTCCLRVSLCRSAHRHG